MEAPKAVYKRARAHHVEPVFGVINGAYAVRNVLILKAYAPLFKLGYNAHKLGELLFVLLRIDQRKVGEYALHLYAFGIAYGVKLVNVVYAKAMEPRIHLQVNLCPFAQRQRGLAQYLGLMP